jgi:histidinol-phosphate/aromatic aminotransferase/cobyric acid decarboxylase-like protein
LKTLSKSIACPGLRFGYAISNKEITEKIQDIRPCYVSNALTNTLVPGLLKEISAHTQRMIETRDFIESNFNTEKSYGNFVLFNDFPAPLKDKVFTRLTGQQLHRMSLVNLTLFNSWL